jgi:MoaA/NifB/PqqE/SkfB family radical SAM enzyme
MCLRASIQGNSRIAKLARVGTKYYWSISAAAWPSPAFNHFISNELHRIKAHQKSTQLQTMIFSITNRCPLECEHCYEWNNLSAQDILSTEELLHILQKVQNYGVSNIQFSGGEPLVRFDALIQLITATRAETELWVLTSGFGLSLPKARALKKAGLSGVVISLDHWSEDLHNQFRNHEKSFSSALEAIGNAKQAGLAVALSLCASRDFVSKDNLEKYYRLAHEMGVDIVRILEPRQVGHYTGLSVELDTAHLDILHKFYLETINSPGYWHMPIIDYTVYHQRLHGCFGAGDRYLYIDSRADVHACPFCQGAAGNALIDEIEACINKLQIRGCHKYH